MGRKSRLKKEKRKHRVKQESKVIAAYYERNPNVFMEEVLGVELYKWQKILLKFIFKWGFKNE